MAYLVIGGHAVEGRTAQRVRYHRQVVRVVVQPLALQAFVAGVRLGVMVSGSLLCQHSGLGVAQRLIKPGVAFSGDFLAAQVVFKRERSVVVKLP